MSGHCAEGFHADCPDTKDDSYTCSCPCHLVGIDRYKTTLFFAWSRVNHLGTPSGVLHAVDQSTDVALCGRKHAGIFRPQMRWDANHESACRLCARKGSR